MNRVYKNRDYQNDAINAAMSFINSKSNKKGILCAPVGSGKSLIIAGIANQFKGKILVAQPSAELLKQNYEKYTSFGNTASIYSASLNLKEIGHVTFATPGSIKGKSDLFDVDLILLDECHLQSNGSRVFGTFIKFFKDAKIIGLTATPIILQNNLFEGSILKMLNRSRKSLFNHFIHVVQVKEIILGGYWPKLNYEQFKVEDSKLKFNSSQAEFTDESQKIVYIENEIEEKIVDRLKTLKEKSILIFVPSVGDAHSLQSKIEGSKVVWGAMDKKERNEVIEGFKNLSIRVVINVFVLSVGFDHPQLDCVIDASPTASFARYYQKLGRLCRRFDHKDINIAKVQGLIIDYSGNYKRFGKMEDIEIKEYPEIGWAITSNKRLLTGTLIAAKPIYITEVLATSSKDVLITFGKYKGKEIKNIDKGYLSWCLENVTWNSYNNDIKNEIKKTLNG